MYSMIDWHETSIPRAQIPKMADGLLDLYSPIHMGVSINGGTPKSSI